MDFGGSGLTMAFLLTGVAFALTFVAVFLYLRSSFRLLEGMHRHAPATWRRLGCPEKVWVDDGDGGIRTIKPLWPWLVWVWKGQAKELSAALGHLNPRLRYVLELRFGLAGGEATTLEQAGERLGVTRERVRQLEARALRELRLFAPDLALYLGSD